MQNRVVKSEGFSSARRGSDTGAEKAAASGDQAGKVVRMADTAHPSAAGLGLGCK